MTLQSTQKSYRVDRNYIAIKHLQTNLSNVSLKYVDIYRHIIDLVVINGILLKLAWANAIEQNFVLRKP